MNLKAHFFYMLVLTLSMLFLSGVCRSQINALPIESVDSSMEASPKPLIILLSTDWCKFCQMQKSQLQKNKVFQNRKDDFYYVMFNAECKEDVVFQGETYRYKPSGASTGIHTLATALNGAEKVTFPTWVVLDQNYEVLFRHSGLLLPAQVNELFSTLNSISD